MTKYFVLTVGLVSGLAIGAGAVIAEGATADVDADTNAGVTAGDAELDAGVDVEGNTSVEDPPQAMTGEQLTTGGDLEMTSDATISSDDLIGASVYDSNEVLVGEISSVVTDTSTGESQVVVDVGGFLGIGEHPVLLGMADLSIETDADGNIEMVTVLRTQAELEALPRYDS